MSKRIEVKYTAGVGEHLLGKTRWLDTERGELFESDNPADLSAVSSGYTPASIVGSWISRGVAVVTAVTVPIPSSYPDGNPKSAQGAKKHSLRLIPTAALVAESEAFADGVQKYGAANWRETGVAASVYIDAAMRHMALYFDGGEDRASDSGAKHLGHARACLGIILDAEAAGKLIDDRPTPMPGLAELLVK